MGENVFNSISDPSFKIYIQVLFSRQKYVRKLNKFLEGQTEKTEEALKVRH